MAVSHIVVKKGGIYSGRGGGVDSERVAYRCLKEGGGIFREGGVDSGRVHIAV